MERNVTRKSLTFISALAALLSLTACSESLEGDQIMTAADQSPDNVVNFSTTLGKSRFTRAGETGAFDTDKLKASTNGFGVFAYYTGKQEYKGYRTKGGASAVSYPNFMYNEQLTFNASDGKWHYNNVKYWPNETEDITNGKNVDDQNENSGNDPATTLLDNGGKVTFFAYAPHVVVPEGPKTGLQEAEPSAKTDGIVAISGNKYVGNDDTGTAPAKDKYSDVYLTYIIPTGNMVDLLWGTTGSNGKGVTGATNLGVLTTVYDAQSGNDYNVNADLTKQTTTGTVEIAFKHALSKVGGSYVGTGIGDDDDPTTATNGLMVILDIDKDGKELGGGLEAYPFDGTSGKELTTGAKAEWNKYMTKVTINEITLQTKDELNTLSGGKFAGKTKDEIETILATDLDFTYGGTYITDLRNKGILNLATGVWSDIEATTAGSSYKQEIVPSSGNPATDATKAAILSEEVAEPANTPARTRDGFEQLPIGVTTVAKNVYEKEAQPFIFIPGTYPIITISITYTVRTYDPKLADAYSEVKQKITKRLYITEAVELNKQYNILMHLGLTSCKFTATVSDWDATDVTGTTTIDPETGEEVTLYEEDVEHIWLPRNVGEPESINPTYKLNTESKYANWEIDGKELTVWSDVLNDANNPALKVTAMKATFDGVEKDVELSGVSLTTDASWITVDNTKKQFLIKEANHSADARTATVNIIYDGYEQPIKVKQLGALVQSIDKVEVSADGTTWNDVTSTWAVPSGSNTYKTRITGTIKKQRVDNTGDASDIPNVVWTDGDTYSITEDTPPTSPNVPLSLTVSKIAGKGTSIVTASNRSADERKNTITVKYGTESKQITVTQAGAYVTALRLNYNGEVGKAGGTIELGLQAQLEDSNGKNLGYIPFTDHINDADADNKVVLTAPSPATRDSDKTSAKFTVAANTGDKRTFTVTANYKKIGSAKVGTKVSATGDEQIVTTSITITQLSGK